MNTSRLNIQFISDYLHGTILGDGQNEITGLASIDQACQGDVTFLSNLKYARFLSTTKASAVVVSADYKFEGSTQATLIKVSNVDLSKIKLLQLFEKSRTNELSFDIHHSAIVDETVIRDICSIGHFTLVEEGVKIGSNTRIESQVWIGKNVSIGEHCHIQSGVKIYDHSIIGNYVTIQANAVIGADGFGYLPDKKGEYHKVPQIGKVVIEDFVEIGANTVIDRATIGQTIIEQGVKLDNLIQIAHNVVIKAHTVIAAQTGIAGSTTIGKHCIIGGQVGIVGHIQIAEGTRIQAQSGVAASVTQKNTKLYGSPAINYRDYLKSYAIFRRLPLIIKKWTNFFGSENIDS